MALRIPVSFTENEEDLYHWAKKKKGKSAFIKELLEEAKHAEEQKKNPIRQHSILEF